ncbi:MAG: putative sugar nucleotidyl transferase [Reichenbachiella sp.]|uniref:putative sugar nucleotidyl transferase n=1 Tax=Reichenbachiella sp. TaxID=2184521 RepID=UPI0032660C88
MQIALADLSQHRIKLFPFTMTRPVGDLRVGILTIQEKWEKHFKQSVDFLTVTDLTPKFGGTHQNYQLVINGALCPNTELVAEILKLEQGQALYHQNTFLAARGTIHSLEEFENQKNTTAIEYDGGYTLIARSWDLFTHNKEQLEADFLLLTADRTSHVITDPHTRVYNPDSIFVEEGVDIKAAILNAEEGSIYLGKNSIVQEGAAIRGPFALGENSRINMNAKIREGVTIGPNCKIGGEVSNSIVYGNSNKAHDGYLGMAVVGEWCNLGADTNNSNLKNNYEDVKVWDFESESLINTGLQFCGLFMGDHSKTAINTMLNTGTTIGVCSNVFGSGFPPPYIPSFSWGGSDQMTVHKIDKAIATAQKVWARKNIQQTGNDEKILKTIFDHSIKSQS